MLYYSPVLRAHLQQLNQKSKITQLLLNSEGKELKTDITFINFDRDEGYLTFLPMKKAKSKIYDTWPNASDSDLDEVFRPEINDLIYNREVNDKRPIGIYGNNFSKIKFGRFIKKILDQSNDEFSEKEIESFINDLKACQTGENYTIQIVRGEDIKKYYKKENYFIDVGTISRSCMNDQDFFDLYSENPEVCQMVIMKVGEKIVPRSLLWKLHYCSVKGVEYLLDRIYFNSDFQKNKIENFANENEFAIRDTRSSFYYKNDFYGDVKMSNRR